MASAKAGAGRRSSLFVAAMSKAAGLWMIAGGALASLVAACNGAQAPDAKPVPPSEKPSTSANATNTAKPGDPSPSDTATGTASAPSTPPTASTTGTPPPIVTKYGGPPPITLPKYGGPPKPPRPPITTKYGGDPGEDI
jgi:hypothetical protein